MQNLFFIGDVIRVRRKNGSIEVLRRDFKKGEWAYFLDVWKYKNYSGFSSVHIDDYIPAQGEVERACLFAFAKGKSPFDVDVPIGESLRIR